MAPHGGNGSPAAAHDLTLADYQEASKYALRVSQEIASYSKLVENSEGIALLERDEVILGDLLGSGGFNHVYEVHAIELMTKDNNNNNSNNTIQYTPAQQQSRRMLTKRGPAALAIKFLNESCKSSNEDYCNGAADLLLETRYLSALASYPHPNIIRLHGVASAGADGFSTGAEGAYFLILDRLQDTLDGRLDVWRELERRKRANLTPEFELHLKALYVKQIQVGIDLASALAHLHKLRIIFRDLKPDNVGFDASGVLKLFDFGLAKELDSRQKNATGLYEMSGATGSRRYMAPEVARSEPYHLSADIYSFGILLWEVISLDKAFWEMSVDDHKQKVIHGEVRPKINTKKWSVLIQSLLTGCWHIDASQRLMAKQISKMLHQDMEAFCKEYNINALQRSRRGTM